MGKETRTFLQHALPLSKNKKKDAPPPPPPGVEEVISKRNGRILSCEKIGSKYKIQVKYPFCRTQFEEFIITPDGKCIECKKTKHYALRLAKKRSAKIKHKFNKKYN